MFNEKKLHFMHIPKTGGVSLLNFLEKQFKPNEICPAFYLPGTANTLDWVNTGENYLPEQVLHNINDEKIRDYKFFRGHLGWVPRTLFLDDEIETITFLRNPIDRLLSLYNYLTRNMSLWDNTLNRWATFDDFVFDKELDGKFANVQIKYFCSDLSFQKPILAKSDTQDTTACPMIELSPHQMLQLAIDRLHSCAFVGLTEHYDESFEWLCMQYKWLPPRKAPKQNVSLKSAQESKFTRRALEHVAEINELDLILYQEADKIFEERKKFRVYYDRRELENEISKKTPPLAEIKFTFADKIIGEGWDAREGVLPNIFCWSSATLSTLCFIVKDHTDLFITFRVIHTLLSELHQKLTLTANGFPVTLSQSFHLEGGLVFEGIIPSDALCKESFLELAFSVPEVIRPIDICKDNRDIRTLGFAFNELEIKPVT